MRIEPRPIDGLIPFANNARTHSENQIEQIAASIKEFGFNNPVLIDKAGGIIAGHGRVLAARLLGMETVPTVELSHLNDEQRRAYILADNRLAELAGWDLDLVALELADLSEAGFDIELTGFDENFLPLHDEPGRVDEDDEPELPADPTTKLGDVWLMGGPPFAMWGFDQHRRPGGPHGRR